MPEAMIRTVVTEGDAANPNNGLPNTEDDYKTKLLKYIPAETVAFYTGLVGVIEQIGSGSGWYVPGVVFLFLAGLIGTPLYLIRIYGMKWQYKRTQIIVSTIAYILWVASIGTLQGLPGLDQIPPAILTVLLGLFTFLAPLIDPGTNTGTQPA